jgi:methylated-DNA-protein-cysteine methyltransferase related protein
MASSRETDADAVERLYRSIYAVVRRIPRGHVATYGQVAELAGIPGGARVAGAAMKTSKPTDRLPWQRVIGKASKLRGRIAIHDPVGAAVQRKLLEDEGITIGETGLVALDEFGWLPTAGSARGASPRRRPRSASKRRASSSRR